MLREAAPLGTAVGLIGIANMVMPPLGGTNSIPNFSGPQPGTPGGGFAATAIANPTVIAGQAIFVGLGLVGVGRLVALFDLPQDNGNFAATAGIFEEENTLPQNRRRGKRGTRKQIITFAKFLLWVHQTIEKGQSKISRYYYMHYLLTDHL